MTTKKECIEKGYDLKLCKFRGGKLVLRLEMTKNYEKNFLIIAEYDDEFFSERKKRVALSGFHLDNCSIDNNLFVKGLIKIIEIKNIVSTKIRHNNTAPMVGSTIGVAQRVTAKIAVINEEGFQVQTRDLNIFSTEKIVECVETKKHSFNWNCADPDFVPVVNRMCPGKQMLSRNLNKRTNTDSHVRTATIVDYLITTEKGNKFEMDYRFN